MSDDDNAPFDMSGLGNLGDMMNNIMGQANQMQSKMAELKEELRGRTVEGQSGGGIVTVTVNGGSEIVRIQIDPVAVDPRDVAMLEDLVVAATNDALNRAREMVREEMKTITGGVSIPGLSDVL
jgi:nucleoid-associated protein EbfC